MKIIDKKTIDNLLEEAKTNSRGRKTLPLKPYEYPGIRLLYNSMLPGTYIQPHRHNIEGLDEHWLLVVGEIAGVSFEEDGSIRDYKVVSSRDFLPLVSMPEKEFHTLVVVNNPATILEITKGPYNPNTYKEFASWAPSETNASEEEKTKYLQDLTSKIFSS